MSLPNFNTVAWDLVIPVAIVFVAASLLWLFQPNPYREFEDEAHADEGGAYQGPERPDGFHLETPPTAAELRDALRDRDDPIRKALNGDASR